MPAQCGAMKRAARKVFESQRSALEAAATELEGRLYRDPFLRDRVNSISVRPVRKSLYSMWRKLQDAGKSIRDICEVAHLQVIIEPYGEKCITLNGFDTPPLAAKAAEKQLCYHVMGLIHSFWAPVPGSIKDYIATPKPNNYQSLHTTVLPTGLAALSRGGSSDLDDFTLFDQNGNGDSFSSGSSGRANKIGPALFPIEVQIRTSEMEKLARFGIAVESWSCADYASPGSSESATICINRRKTPSVEQNGHCVDSMDSHNSIEDRYEKAESSNRFSIENKSSGSSGLVEQNPTKHANGYSTSINVQGSQTSDRAGTGRLDPQIMSRRINWLNSIRQWQEEFVGTLTAQEFVACVTDDLLGQGVFVFTPSGQVMRLPKGSTVVDFAYHIHTDIGNTMVAARVNGKVVNADHELANAEVVEVITYKGPINATIIKRHQKWLMSARTKTARYKLAKFLREHAALAAANGLMTLPNYVQSTPMDPTAAQRIWLLAECEDRPGLLADISKAIAAYEHNINSYSGSVDQDAGLFVMEYELEGPPNELQGLCEQLSKIRSVRGWAVGCSMKKR